MLGTVRTSVAAMAATAVAAVAAGCGLGPGAGTSNVSLTVTRGFGDGQVAAVSERRVAGSETVMRMLERSFHVQTRFGGGFVESINGQSGDSVRHDWFYYVNGIEAAQGAASTAVHRGDRIWWDLHDWTVTEFGAGGGRVVSRAVRARDRRQAAADRGRVCQGCRLGVRDGLSRAEGRRRAGREPAARHRFGQRFARVARRDLEGDAARDRREPDRARPGAQRGLRAVRGRRRRFSATARPRRPRRAHPRRRFGTDRRHPRQCLRADVADHRD